MRHNVWYFLYRNVRMVACQRIVYIALLGADLNKVNVLIYGEDQN